MEQAPIRRSGATLVALRAPYAGVRPGRGTPRPRMILPMLRWPIQLHRSSENERMDDMGASPAAESHCGSKGEWLRDLRTPGC